MDNLSNQGFGEIVTPTGPADGRQPHTEDGDDWRRYFDGRLVYHATPLHYLPAILASGALQAKSVTQAVGIAPRRSAVRRDCMLGLADYVHFSMAQVTPMLVDKLARGYPHAVLTFDGAAIASSSGAALLRGNTKTWATRSALAPVTDPVEMRHLLNRHFEAGKAPGLELLAHYAAGLDALRAIAFIDDAELAIASPILALYGSLHLATLLPALAGVLYRPAALTQTAEYYDRCVETGIVEPPPRIDYD